MDLSNNIVQVYESNKTDYKYPIVKIIELYVLTQVAIITPLCVLDAYYAKRIGGCTVLTAFPLEDHVINVIIQNEILQIRY